MTRQVQHVPGNEPLPSIRESPDPPPDLVDEWDKYRLNGQIRPARIH